MARFDKLLVLDLDETLIHTVFLSDSRDIEGEPSFHITDHYAVYERPGVREFLARVLENFEAVGVWTAGTRAYALEILPHLCDPSKFSFIWGRNRCTWQRNFDDLDPHCDGKWWSEVWIKDIRKLRRRGYRKEKILFVEDTPQNIKRSYGNLIPVRKFCGDPADDELKLLGEYLDHIGKVPNVRTIEKRFWRTMSPP